VEVAQDDDRGMVLQSTVNGHIITVDPQIISHFIGIPVLDLPGSPYNEVVLPPSMDDLREFFHVVPQGEERATIIWIGTLPPSHRLLAKIVQHNLWLVVRHSDLILKNAQFVYAIHLHLPFCLCKNIMSVMLEARDESNTGLPFGCLLTQIILQSGINSDDEMPIPPTMPVGFPDMASSSQTVSPSELKINFSQIMEALAAIRGGISTM